MSALGHKRTFCDAGAMSGLHPKADLGSHPYYTGSARTDGASMTSDYATSLATPDDIPGILALQDPNLPDSGGKLSVRLTEIWFKQAVADPTYEKP